MYRKWSKVSDVKFILGSSHLAQRDAEDKLLQRMFVQVMDRSCEVVTGYRIVPAST